MQHKPKNVQNRTTMFKLISGLFGSDPKLDSRPFKGYKGRVALHKGRIRTM